MATNQQSSLPSVMLPSQQVSNSQMVQYTTPGAMPPDAVFREVAPAPHRVTPVIAAVAGQTDLNTAQYGVPGMQQIVST